METEEGRRKLAQLVTGNVIPAKTCSEPQPSTSYVSAVISHKSKASKIRSTASAMASKQASAVVSPSTA